MNTHLPTFATVALEQLTSSVHDWRILTGPRGEDSLTRLEHAAHEWILTLSREAVFLNPPKIWITITKERQLLRCRLSDNSDGVSCASIGRSTADEASRASLYMMRLMADRIVYQRGRQVNRLTLSVKSHGLRVYQLHGAGQTLESLPDHLAACLDLRSQEATQRERSGVEAA
ncbi:MAG: hypothetical protein HKN29_02860 [Rhodothermales bacterium]|nr:hypothetical protein [Rhodothermales bacterium]